MPFHNCILTPIQNLVKFTKKSKPCVTLEIQNPDILTALEHLELCHIQILTDIQNSLTDLRRSGLQK